MLSFQDYFIINEGLSTLEGAKMLDFLVKRVRGKVITRNLKVLPSIVLRPNEWCWYVSMQGNRFQIYNINGEMRVVRKGDRETKPSPEMLVAVRLIS